MTCSSRRRATTLRLLAAHGRLGLDPELVVAVEVVRAGRRAGAEPGVVWASVGLRGSYAVASAPPLSRTLVVQVELPSLVDVGEVGVAEPASVARVRALVVAAARRRCSGGYGLPRWASCVASTKLWAYSTPSASASDDSRSRCSRRAVRAGVDERGGRRGRAEHERHQHDRGDMAKPRSSLERASVVMGHHHRVSGTCVVRQPGSRTTSQKFTVEPTAAGEGVRVRRRPAPTAASGVGGAVGEVGAPSAPLPLNQS